MLPLLPTQAIDPWGALVPRSLWLLVVLIAALSLVGYVATRALGPERGTAVTGLTGGLVSSTAVTLTFAKRSREEKGATDDALAAGTFLAWGVSFARVLVLAALVHAPLALLHARPVRRDGARHRRERAPVAAPLARRRPRRAAPVVLRNPFSLISAVKFGLLFAGVLLAMTRRPAALPQRAGRTWSRRSPAPATSTRSRSRWRRSPARATAPLRTAALAILIAVLSNTLVKCGISAGLGGPRLRRSRCC